MFALEASEYAADGRCFSSNSAYAAGWLIFPGGLPGILTFLRTVSVLITALPAGAGIALADWNL